MTWLGKIFTVLVLLLSLAWAWLTVTTYVTRTNWRTRAETYKLAYDKAVARLDEERAKRVERVEGLETQLATSRGEAKALGQQVQELTTQRTESAAKYNNIWTAVRTLDKDVPNTQALREADFRELEQVRARNNALEDRQQELAIARQNAEKDKLYAENEAKRFGALADDREKQNESLREQLRVAKIENRGAGGSVDTGGPPPPPTPENLKAHVIAYKQGFVEVSVGLDAGIQPNAILEVERLSGGGKYLGTIKVLPEGLETKKAVGVFQPMSGKPIGQLKADELPKFGDLVRPRKQ